MQRPYGISYSLLLCALLPLGFFAVAVSLAHSFHPSIANFIQLGANYGPKIGQGEWWRPLVSIFLTLRLASLVCASLSFICLGRLCAGLGDSEIASTFLVCAFAGAVTDLYSAPLQIFGGPLSGELGLLAMIVTVRIVRGESEELLKRRLSLALAIILCLVQIWLRPTNAVVDKLSLVISIGWGSLLGFVLSRPNLGRKAFVAATLVGAFSACYFTVTLPKRDDLAELLKTVKQDVTRYLAAVAKYPAIAHPHTAAEFKAQRIYIEEQLISSLAKTRADLLKLEPTIFKPQVRTELYLVQMLTIQAKSLQLGSEEQERLTALEAQFHGGKISAEQISNEIAAKMIPQLVQTGKQEADLLKIPELKGEIQKAGNQTLNDLLLHQRRDLEHRIMNYENRAVIERLNADAKAYFKLATASSDGRALKYINDEFKTHLEATERRRQQINAYLQDVERGGKADLVTNLISYEKAYTFLQADAVEQMLKAQSKTLVRQLPAPGGKTKVSAAINLNLKPLLNQLPPGSRAPAIAPLNPWIRDLKIAQTKALDLILRDLRINQSPKQIRADLAKWSELDRSPAALLINQAVLKIRTETAKPPSS